jgi:hypothetical protein
MGEGDSQTDKRKTMAAEDQGQSRRDREQQPDDQDDVQRRGKSNTRQDSQARTSRWQAGS